jgi:hypothetical protein
MFGCGYLSTGRRPLEATNMPPAALNLSVSMSVAFPRTIVMAQHFTWQAVFIIAIATITALVRTSRFSAQKWDSRRLALGNVALLIGFGIGAWIVTQEPYLLRACGQGLDSCNSVFAPRIHGER